jgi:hypothetical protein
MQHCVCVCGEIVEQNGSKYAGSPLLAATRQSVLNGAVVNLNKTYWGSGICSSPRIPKPEKHFGNWFCFCHQVMGENIQFLK